MFKGEQIEIPSFNFPNLTLKVDLNRNQNSRLLFLFQKAYPVLVGLIRRRNGKTQTIHLPILKDVVVKGDLESLILQMED